MSQETKLSKNEDLLPLIKTYRNNLEKQINKVYIFGENKKRKLKLPFVELISIEKSEYSYKQLLASQLLDRSSLIKRSTNLENTFENENLNIDGNEKSSNDKLETTKKIKTSKKPEMLLKTSSRALIFGVPGSGKSILLKYLALQTLLLDEKLDHLPIFIELKSITQNTFTEAKGNFVNLLIENIINKAVKLTKNSSLIIEYLQKMLVAGKVSVFLDGLDEIKEESFFDTLCNSISEFLKTTNPNNSVIVSSRPYVLPTKFESLNELEITPLSSEQVREFVTHYYPKKSYKLLKYLKQKQELTRVPLLLCILISLYQKGKNANYKLEFYEQIISYLLNVSDKKNIPHKSNVVSKENKVILKLLKELAFEKLFDGKIDNTSQKFVFTEEEIRKKAQEVSLNSKESALLIEDIKASALIREIANKTYAFTHLTIQEYLAALALSEQDKAEQLMYQTYFDETLVQLETLPMAIALHQNPANIFQKLRELPESLEYTNFRLRLRIFTYLTSHHKEILSNEIKDISSQFIKLLKDANSLQRPYQKNFSSILSSWPSVFLDVVVEAIEEAHMPCEKTSPIEAIKFLENIGREEVVECLIKFLASYGYASTLAIKALGVIGDGRAIKHLIPMLKNSNDSYTIRNILEKLALDIPNSRKAVSKLIPQLSNPDKVIRCTAAIALSCLPSSKAIEPLSFLLYDSESSVSSWAVHALGKIGGDEALDLLINALPDLNDPDSFDECDDMLSSVIGALANIGSESTIDILTSALSFENTLYNAAYGLAQIGTDQTIEILASSLFEEVDEENADLYAYRQDSITEHLIEFIENDKVTDVLIKALFHCSFTVSDPAAMALSDIAETKTTDKIINAINALASTLLVDNDYQMRQLGVLYLRKSRNPKALELLLSVAFDSHIQVRSYVAEVLGNIANEQTVDVLINLLSDTDLSVRGKAIEALGKIRSKKASEHLVRFLSDPNINLQYNAAMALGKVGEEIAIEPLINFLPESIYDHRFETPIEILGRLGAEKAIEPLLLKLFHPHKNICSKAANALQDIKLSMKEKNKFGQKLLNLIYSENISVRKKVIEIAGYYLTGNEFIEKLTHIIVNDFDLEIREFAKLILFQYENKLKLLKE